MIPYLRVLIEFISPDENDRKNHLRCIEGYRPHFLVIGDTEYLGVQFVEVSKKNISPKEQIPAKVSLMFYPDVTYSNLCEGADFEILEGVRVVGTGRVISPMLFDE